jgi:hypothetical protein
MEEMLRELGEQIAQTLPGAVTGQSVEYGELTIDVDAAKIVVSTRPRPYTARPPSLMGSAKTLIGEGWAREAPGAGAAPSGSAPSGYDGGYGNSGYGNSGYGNPAYGGAGYGAGQRGGNVLTGALLEFLGRPLSGSAAQYTPTLNEQAALALYQGDQRAALELYHAHLIAERDSASSSLNAVGFSPLLRRPAWAIRLGVSLNAKVPPSLADDPQPIREGDKPATGRSRSGPQYASGNQYASGSYGSPESSAGEPARIHAPCRQVVAGDGRRTVTADSHPSSSALPGEIRYRPR